MRFVCDVMSPLDTTSNTGQTCMGDPATEMQDSIVPTAEETS